jgi:hypothetical protein
MSRYQLLPPLSQAEYDALRDDIAAAGIRQPIDVDENGVILDGHHRKQIADELGIECPERVVRGLAEFAKADYALTVNAARRHLDRDGKRELVKASLKLHPRLSDREHARRCGVSHNTVSGVRVAMEESGQLVSLTSRTGGDGRERPASRPSPMQAGTGSGETADVGVAAAVSPLDHPETGEAHAGLDDALLVERRGVEAGSDSLAGDGDAGLGGTSPASPQTATDVPISSVDGPVPNRHAGPAAGPTSPGPAVTPDQEFMTRFIAALAKSGGWMQFDAERVAELASETTWDAIEAHADVVAHTYERMRGKRFALRLIEGGVA